MIVDLNPLPYKLATNIIKWCAEHDVDREKCIVLIEAMATVGNNLNDDEWTLNIPDKYITLFVLKFNHEF